jgi:hypothetical protein
MNIKVCLGPNFKLGLLKSLVELKPSKHIDGKVQNLVFFFAYHFHHLFLLHLLDISTFELQYFHNHK